MSLADFFKIPLLGLKMYKAKDYGFSDLLNYAFLVDEGIIIGKDGSLMAAFEYHAQDVFSATPSQRNTTARQLNQLLNKFDGGWSVQFDSIRTPINYYPPRYDNYFTDSVSLLIDEERRQLFERAYGLYQSKNFVTLTYLPPSKTTSKMTDLMFEDGNKKKSIAQKVLKEFKEKLREFASLASTNFIAIKQLKQKKKIDRFGNEYYIDELLSFINHSIVGIDKQLHFPNCVMYLDNLFGYDFITGVTPKIDNKYIQVVSIDGYPQESYANILDSLSQLDIEYRWNTRFVFLDNYDAIKSLDKIRRKWKQKERGMMAQMFNPTSTKVDLDAVEMVNQTDQAIMEVNSGVLKYGYHNTSIVIFDHDRQKVEDAAYEVRRIIESLGFPARIEDINAVESYLGTLPSMITPNLRQNLIGSMNLTHLLPLSTVWQGNKYNESDKFPPQSPALLYTLSGTTPFKLNLHVSDIGHTLIFGPTGAGKSTLLALLVAQARKYPNARMFAFDKGMSLYPYTIASGGDHYEIAGDESKLAFAPLANLTKEDLSWAEGWVLNLLKLQGVEPTPSHKELIHHALNLHYENKSKSLTDFISNVQDNELRSALNHYSINGSMGHILDAEEDNLALSDFSVFEIEELMNLSLEDAVPVLLYLFRQIEKSLDGHPTFLILDEAWIMLGHPVFRDKIREWLKVLRKANCAVILATQSLSDAAKSGILDVLQESCPTKILLPNPEAQNKGTENNWGPADYYTSFGLNEREIEIISQAVAKREYYYKSPHGSRLFNLVLGDVALSFVGASGKKDISRIKELQREHKDWIPHYLEERGIHQDYITFYKENQHD